MQMPPVWPLLLDLKNNYRIKSIVKSIFYPKNKKNIKTIANLKRAVAASGGILDQIRVQTKIRLKNYISHELLISQIKTF